MLELVQTASPLWISLRSAGIATAIALGAGVAVAYVMANTRSRWRSLLDSILISPLILPPTVVGLVLLMALGRNSPLGALLSRLDLNPVFTSYAAIITATIAAFPLVYRTALGSFQQLDHTLPQAARTLGSSEGRIFWQIVLPLTLPGVLAGATLAFARALGEFGATLMLAGNIPGRTQTIPMAIYFAIEAGDFTTAWIWAAIVSAISLAAILALQGVQAWPGQQRLRLPKPNSFAHPAPATCLPIAQVPECYDCAAAVPTPTQITATQPNLEVDITKRMSDFTLRVRFTTGDRTLGLLGASGAGKSLILRCIAGIAHPDEGRIVLNGRVLFDSERKINLPVRDRRVSLLFQNYALFPHLTVAENIAFGLDDSISRGDRRQGIGYQLAALQLEDLAQRYPHQLSGGQQQRVALARALASQPEALLLDEPFSALDTHLRAFVEKQVIARLATYPGVTLFVTHNLEEAYRVCEDLLVIEQGQAIAAAPKQQIFERPQTVRVAELTGCKNFSQARQVGDDRLYAEDWNCTLTCVEPILPDLRQVGIRAHQIAFLAPAQPDSPSPHPSLVGETLRPSDATLPNVFPAWLAATSETPHRMTLYLKLHHPPTCPGDYHLQAEVFKEKWALLKDLPAPWSVYLDPLRLVPLL